MRDEHVLLGADGRSRLPVRQAAHLFLNRLAGTRQAGLNRGMPSTADVESRTIPLLAVLLLVDSLHFVFARLMAPCLPATVAGLYRLGVATVEVGLYLVARCRLQIGVHAVVLTLSPVVTSVWSLLLFGTWPTVTGFIGGAVVFAGVILVSRGRRRRLKRGVSAEKAPRW